MKQPNTKRKYPAEFLVDIISAGLVGDSAKVELAALSLARSIKTDDPDSADKIFKAIGAFAISGVVREKSDAPIPVDSESQLEIASITAPNVLLYRAPILSEAILLRVQNFIDERNNIEKLLANGIRPPTSILLTGQPGTGKTMLARYIASALGKNLVTLDLSASVSSLMGKTAANLKRVLQYAKQNPCVLLFDEFDAIAKKRNDSTDLGEIKRVVNVLLMELEDWPSFSTFVATSNHPELLDKAVWRRFDHALVLDNPEKKQRSMLLHQELGSYIDHPRINSAILEPISELLVGKSAAEIEKYTNNVKRRIILRNENPLAACLLELEQQPNAKGVRGKFVTLAKSVFGKRITVREIAELTGLSPAGVQHHLSKSK